MPQPLSGPGVGLPLPQFLYPTELLNASYDFSTNAISLSPGDTLPLPPGDLYIDVGNYSVLQWLDPISGVWRSFNTSRGKTQFVKSDGYTLRVANLTACPIGAAIAGAGSGFAQSSATVTASVGGSTWQPIIGGAVSYVSMAAHGASYTMPPIVVVPGPPSAAVNGVGGVPATAHAVIASGTVTSIVFDNVGAGYATAPTPIILPNPLDPNFGSITTAAASVALVGAGSITAVLCTNNGASLATLSALTLTPAGGAGTGATLTPIILQTVASTSIVAGGAGLGVVAQPCGVGGIPPVPVAGDTNAAFELNSLIPRAYLGIGTCNAGGTITTLTTLDGGLFNGAPTAILMPGAGGGTGTVAAIAASITFVGGGAVDSILIQPAP